MSITAASLVAKVSAEGVDTAKSQLSDMGNMATGIGGIFKNALGGTLNLAAGLAGDALSFLKDQFVDSIQIAMRHQDVMGQTAQAIKSTGGAAGETSSSIGDLALSLSKVTDFSDDTIQSGENLLLTFTGIGKDVFPATTQTMLDMAQAMGGDTKGAAIMLGKALNDPTTGLSALTRVGVTFSTQEQQQIKTMMSHNDVIGAQKVMLKELGTEFGGSAMAAGKTFGGQMEILGNQFDDIKQKISMAVLPILSQLVGFISSAAMPILDAFGAWFTSTAIPAFEQFGQKVLALGSFFTPLLGPLQVLGQNIQGMLLPAFQRLAGMFNQLFAGNSISGAGLLQAAVTGIGNALNWATDRIDDFYEDVVALQQSPIVPQMRQFASTLSAELRPALQNVGAAIVNVANFLQSPGFASFASGAGQELVQIFGGISKVGQQSASVIGTNFVPTMQKLGGIFQTDVLPVIQKVAGFIGANFLPVMQQIGGFLVSTFTPVWQQLVSTFNSQLLPAWNNLVKAIQPLLPQIKPFAEFLGGVLVVAIGLVIGVIGGLIKAFAGLLSGAIQIIGGLVTFLMGAFQTMTGFINLFVDIVTGKWGNLGNDLAQIGSGIVNMFQGLWQIIQGIWTMGIGAVSGFVSGFVTTVIGFFTSLWDKLVGHSVIPDMINGIVSWFGQLPGRAIAFVVGLYNMAVNNFNALKSAMTVIIQDAINTVVSVFQGLPGKVQGIISGIPGILQNILGTLGPKALAWAGDMINGFISGIQNGIANIGNAASNIAGTIKSFLHFSKPDLGPLADYESWMPDFTSKLAEGLNTGLDKIRGASLNVASTLSVAASPLSLPQGVNLAPSFASQASTQPQGDGTPVIFQVDGIAFARATLPYTVNAIRNSTGVRI